MDDGRAKQPLPLVVLNSTTMASNRQYSPYKLQLKTIDNRKN